MSVTANALRTLHRIHRQLADVRSRLQRGPRQIKAAEAGVRQRHQDVETAKANVQRARISADQKELQLREREERIQDLRLKLNAATSNREYQTLLEQIAADEQANSVLSDEILELLDKITQLQQSVVLKEEELHQAEGEQQKLRSRLDQEVQALEMELARLDQELAAAEAELPADVRAEYQRVIKVRGEEAMAPLDGDCCGGCYQVIPPQMVNELLMDRLVLCKSCGCLLYIPEDREPKRSDRA
jgi:predicted  nucleic acid-binding Zn-ribbon protein